MEETLFYSYVSDLLRQTGHMTQSAPIYINQSVQTVLYIENERTVFLSDTDCDTLSCVSHVSLLTELKWDERETVQLYAITVHFPFCHRSQDVAEIHRILQGTWRNRHSIVFFQNDDMWTMSFADDTVSHMLSDWFSFEYDETKVLERLAIENMSLTDCTAYFQDFQYAMVREYYRHPISRSEARYALFPKDYRLTKYKEDGDFLTESYVSTEEFRSLLQERIFYYEYQYGDDYVAPSHAEVRNIEEERWIRAKIERKAEEEEEAERRAREEAIEHLVFALQQVIAKARVKEAEHQIKEAMADQLAVAFQQIRVRAARIAEAKQIAEEEAERRAREEAQRQAKTKAICQVAFALQQVIAKTRVEEAEHQIKEAMAGQLAVAFQQIRVRATRIAEAKRIAMAFVEEKRRLCLAHEERVHQLKTQCTMEKDMVQTEQIVVTRRLTEIEKDLTKLHLIQFTKKKKLKMEQDALLQKEKQLRLLMTKMEESFQKQLEKEESSYLQALVACKQQNF